MFSNKFALSDCYKAIVTVKEVIYGYIIELGKLVRYRFIKAVAITRFKIYVCAARNADNSSHFLLHKTELVSAKSQTVGDVINILVRMILLVK